MACPPWVYTELKGCLFQHRYLDLFVGVEGVALKENFLIILVISNAWRAALSSKFGQSWRPNSGVTCDQYFLVGLTLI